jgi:regulator of protease activity HflC (stomatin/prohibitin superfamily)
MKAQFERDTAIKRAGFLAETDEAQARAAQAGPLAEAYRKRTLAEADRDQSRFAAEATAFSRRTIAEAEAEAARAASVREGNQELIAANRLVEVLPALVDAAARGLAGSNLTILNGTQGVNEVVTGTVAGPGPMTAATSTPSIEAD